MTIVQGQSDNHVKAKTDKIIDYSVIGTILLFSFGLQLCFALKLNHGYDEAWGLFYGKIQPFWAFFTEIKHNAHPPLSYFFIRIAVLFGDQLIWARLASIMASIITIFTFILCFRKLKIERPVAYLCILIMAISHTYVSISVCIRGYIFAVMFLIIAYYFFIDILQNITKVKSINIFFFLFFTLCAIWTEYCAIFVIAAMMIALFILILFKKISTKEILLRSIKERWQLFFFSIGVIGLVKFFKWTSMPVWQGHISKYYLAKDESLISFAIKGLAANISYFTPLYSKQNFWFILQFIILTAMVSFFIYRYMRLSVNNIKAHILLVLVLLFPILFLLGVSGLYPYGGHMRHQFILFPFIIFVFAICLNDIYYWLRFNILRLLFYVFICIGAIIISVNSFNGPQAEEFPGNLLFEKEYSELEQIMTNENSIYLSAFNQIAVYYHTFDWEWTYQRTLDDFCYLYLIKKGGLKIPVIVDRSTWIPPAPTDINFLERINGFMEKANIKKVLIFSAISTGSTLPPDLEAINEQLKKSSKKRALMINSWHKINSGYIYAMSQISI